MASLIDNDDRKDISAKLAGSGTSSIVIHPTNPGEGGASQPPQPPQPPNASGSSSGSNIDWNSVAVTVGLGLLVCLVFGSPSRSA